MKAAGDARLPAGIQYVIVCASIAASAPLWILIVGLYGVTRGDTLGQALYEIPGFTLAMWLFGAGPALAGTGVFFGVVTKLPWVRRSWTSGHWAVRTALLVLVNAPLVIVLGALLMLALFEEAGVWVLWAPMPVLGGVIAGLWLDRAHRRASQP